MFRELNIRKVEREGYRMTYPNLRQAIWLLVLLILMEAGLGILIHVAGLISGQPLEHNNYLLGISKLGGLSSDFIVRFPSYGSTVGKFFASHKCKFRLADVALCRNIDYRNGDGSF